RRVETTVRPEGPHPSRIAQNSDRRRPGPRGRPEQPQFARPAIHEGDGRGPEAPYRVEEPHLPWPHSLADNGRGPGAPGTLDWRPGADPPAPGHQRWRAQASGRHEGPLAPEPLRQ